MWWDRHGGLEQVDGFVEQRERATGGNVHATTIKMMLDGCPESCTGSMLDPYEGAFGDRHGLGMQFIDPELLTGGVHGLGRARLPGASTCVGGPGDPNGPRRGGSCTERQRPERRPPPHGAHPASRPRRPATFASSGVAANLQPFWSQPDPAIEVLCVPRVGRARGAPVPDRRHPRQRRGDGVRQRLAGVDAGPVARPWRWRSPGRRRATPIPRRWTPAQRIDLAAGMAAFTTGTAWINHDDDAGSLAPGKRADLAVLDRNPFDRTRGRDRRDAGGDDDGGRSDRLRCVDGRTKRLRQQVAP